MDVVIHQRSVVSQCDCNEPTLCTQEAPLLSRQLQGLGVTGPACVPVHTGRDRSKSISATANNVHGCSRGGQASISRFKMLRHLRFGLTKKCEHSGAQHVCRHDDCHDPDRHLELWHAQGRHSLTIALVSVTALRVQPCYGDGRCSSVHGQERQAGRQFAQSLCATGETGKHITVHGNPMLLHSQYLTRQIERSQRELAR